MKYVEIPMWRGKELVGLSHILESVDSGPWLWKILEFSGVGSAPRNMSMPEFEALVSQCSDGYKLNWNELTEFAKGVEQTWNCLIVALDPSDSRSHRTLGEEDRCEAHLTIEGIDSSTWRIGARDYFWLKRLQRSTSE